MNILKSDKIPEFKIPKFNFDNLSEFGNIKVKFGKNKDEKKLKGRRNYNPKDYEKTNYKTIKEVFDRSTRLYSEKVFIHEKFGHDTFQEITYGKFREDVISLGTAIREILKIKNEKIAVIGENTYEWYVSYMSLLCSDNISVNLDKDISNDEIINLINRSGAKAVIFSKKKKDIFESIKKDIPTVKYFIEMYSEESLKNENVGFEYLLSEGKKVVENGNDEFLKIEIDENEFKVLIFTSGTTSKPKGVMICNKNLAQNINAVSTYVHILPTDIFFSVLPLHHTYESTIGFLLPMAYGCSIAVCQGLRYLIDDMKEVKPTVMLAVPLLLEKLYKRVNESIKNSKKESIVNSMIYVTNVLKYSGIDIKQKVFKEILINLGGSMRIIVSAAAPIDATIIKWFEDIGIEILQGYGLTETAPIAALTPEFDRKPGSVGKPVNCAEFKIDNPNENGEGEILIKSDTLMLGYYKDKEKTDEVVVDGWFHSGDIGYIDQKQNVFVTGRCKNVIVTKNGKNIYPEELELLIGNLAEVKECVVVGKESTMKDDLVITAMIFPNYQYISKKYSVDSSENEKIQEMLMEKIKEINEKLPSYKRVKKVEVKQKEFDKTTTMKIKR